MGVSSKQGKDSMKQYTANDYGSRAVKAAHRVLIELTQVLDQYEEHTAIVGGWVPPLLMPHSRHIGSIDVDLAIDHKAIQGAPLGPIRKLLEQSAYYPDGKRAFIFHRDVELNDGETPDPVVVQVDFVAAEYGLAGKNRRSQPIQDFRAHKARGADLVFNRKLVERVPIIGYLPNGTEFDAQIRVAGPVPFIVMKANALKNRNKHKDAYDIWFLLKNHPAGLDGLADALIEHANHGLVQEALDHLAQTFAAADGKGPTAVARFHDDLQPGTEQYEQTRQDAYQRVRFILEKLGWASRA